MSILRNELKVKDNSIRGYIPARTKVAKEGDFDWEFAAAGVIRNLYRIEVNPKALKEHEPEASSKSDFVCDLIKNSCEQLIKERSDDPDLWEVVNNMYFEEQGLYSVAPLTKVALLQDASKSSPKRKLLDLFTTLMNGNHLREQEIDFQPSNFLEGLIQEGAKAGDTFTGIAESRELMSTGTLEQPYLPWLSKLFSGDLKFLAKHQQYFNASLVDFLKLYGFLYTAQLTLNITNIESEPTTKPLYFIMENEKASKERVELVDHGYKRVASQMRFLFPYLSISESLQHTGKEVGEKLRPLWWLASKLEEQDASALKKYALEFMKDREDEQNIDALEKEQHSAIGWLQKLLDASVRQFDKGKKRAAAQEKFIRTVKTELCSHFVRMRGDRGNVLVMNQDYITLITNLVIGESETLRFSELIDGFNQRGIYFDKKSQKALVNFFERMGNVERMSDSGDAVYVRKTI